MKVENMTSPRGNVVPNQFIIHTDEGTFFQSYNSIIVKITPNQTYLDENCWDYSVTTGKYRNNFLGENKAETQRKINNGTYKLVNLNL